MATNQRIAETSQIVPGIRKRRYAFIEDRPADVPAKESDAYSESKNTTHKETEGRRAGVERGVEQGGDFMHCD